jgi:uridylate kinase
MACNKYSRILLKLSGESFKGERGYGIDPIAIEYLATQINHIHELGVEIGVVVGGGNIWRGKEAQSGGMERAAADYAGMLATVINALALQDALERHHGVDTRVQSAIDVQQIAEPYIRRRAIRHLEKGRVVLFSSGTGNPFMTTDTAAALRGIEMEAQVMLMAKHDVDGVYTSDPKTDSTASKIDSLTYLDAIERRLAIMDTTALTLCMENELPIIVFDLFQPHNLKAIVQGEQLGSLVASKPRSSV